MIFRSNVQRELGNSPSLNHGDLIDLNVDQIKSSLAILQDGLSRIMSSGSQQSTSEKDKIFLLNYEAAKINSDLIKLSTAYRLSNKLLPLRAEEQVLFDFLEDELLRIKPLSDAKSLTAKLSCAKDLLWYFDTDLISMILNGVLLNTIRYSRSTIEITVSLIEESLLITVEDDSDGFPETMLSDNPSGPSRKEASVLFCDEIASLHRQGERYGSVDFSNNSKLGGGKFSLTLP